MKTTWFRNSLAVAGFIGASAGLVSAQNYKTAVPGTVNYVEGQVSIEGRPLDPKQNGNNILTAEQSIQTGNGKAEVLLSPGVFLREGSNSEVRMISPGLVDPTVEVVRGSAMVEVDQKLKDARVDVIEHGSTTSILKEGLYKFNSDQGTVAVVDGKVNVSENGASKEFGKGKQVSINGEPLQTVSFDRKAQDDLYRWSSVRSGYLAEANASTAKVIYGGGGMWGGSGWYWNPYFSSYSWLPGDGFFYSPFGYPFYSPAYVVYSPVYSRGGFGYRGGYRAGAVTTVRPAAPVAQGFASRPAVSVMPRMSAGTGGFRSMGGGGIHAGIRR